MTRFKNRPTGQLDMETAISCVTSELDRDLVSSKTIDICFSFISGIRFLEIIIFKKCEKLTSKPPPILMANEG